MRTRKSSGHSERGQAGEASGMGDGVAWFSSSMSLSSEETYQILENRRGLKRSQGKGKGRKKCDRYSTSRGAAGSIEDSLTMEDGTSTWKFDIDGPTKPTTNSKSLMSESAIAHAATSKNSFIETSPDESSNAATTVCGKEKAGKETHTPTSQTPTNAKEEDVKNNFQGSSEKAKSTTARNARTANDTSNVITTLDVTLLAIQSALPSLLNDDGDPPWRTEGHPYLGRRVKVYPLVDSSTSSNTKSPKPGSSGGPKKNSKRNKKVKKVMVGTIAAYISHADTDSMGNPAFISPITNKREDLFHVVFEEGIDLVMDLEEAEFDLIGENEEIDVDKSEAMEKENEKENNDDCQNGDSEEFDEEQEDGNLEEEKDSGKENSQKNCSTGKRSRRRTSKGINYDETVGKNSSSNSKAPEAENKGKNNIKSSSTTSNTKGTKSASALSPSTASPSGITSWRVLTLQKKSGQGTTVDESNSHHAKRISSINTSSRGSSAARSSRTSINSLNSLKNLNAINSLRRSRSPTRGFVTRSGDDEDCSELDGGRDRAARCKKNQNLWTCHGCGESQDAKLRCSSCLCSKGGTNRMGQSKPKGCGNRIRSNSFQKGGGAPTKAVAAAVASKIARGDSIGKRVTFSQDSAMASVNDKEKTSHHDDICTEGSRNNEVRDHSYDETEQEENSQEDNNTEESEIASHRSVEQRQSKDSQEHPSLVVKADFDMNQAEHEISEDKDVKEHHVHSKVEPNSEAKSDMELDQEHLSSPSASKSEALESETKASIVTPSSGSVATQETTTEQPSTKSLPMESTEGPSSSFNDALKAALKSYSSKNPVQLSHNLPPPIPPPFLSHQEECTLRTALAFVMIQAKRKGKERKNVGPGASKSSQNSLESVMNSRSNSIGRRNTGHFEGNHYDGELDERYRDETSQTALLGGLLRPLHSSANIFSMSKSNANLVFEREMSHIRDVLRMAVSAVLPLYKGALEKRRPSSGEAVSDSKLDGDGKENINNAPATNKGPECDNENASKQGNDESTGDSSSKHRKAPCAVYDFEAAVQPAMHCRNSVPPKSKATKSHFATLDGLCQHAIVRISRLVHNHSFTEKTRTKKASGPNDRNSSFGNMNSTTLGTATHNLKENNESLPQQDSDKVTRNGTNKADEGRNRVRDAIVKLIHDDVIGNAYLSQTSLPANNFESQMNYGDRVTDRRFKTAQTTQCDERRIEKIMASCHVLHRLLFLDKSCSFGTEVVISATKILTDLYYNRYTGRSGANKDNTSSDEENIISESGLSTDKNAPINRQRQHSSTKESGKTSSNQNKERNQVVSSRWCEAGVEYAHDRHERRCRAIEDMACASDLSQKNSFFTGRKRQIYTSQNENHAMPLNASHLPKLADVMAVNLLRLLEGSAAIRLHHRQQRFSFDQSLSSKVASVAASEILAEIRSTAETELTMPIHSDDAATFYYNELLAKRNERVSRGAVFSFDDVTGKVAFLRPGAKILLRLHLFDLIKKLTLYERA